MFTLTILETLIEEMKENKNQNQQIADSIAKAANLKKQIQDQRNELKKLKRPNVLSTHKKNYLSEKTLIFNDSANNVEKII